MAGDWIKMRMNLRTHPKVVRIASALNADRYRVIGALHAVWCLADEHAQDGELSGYTKKALDDSIGWPGFSDVMVDVGWLRDESQGLVLPRFDEHNGASAKRRATEAERKRRDRETSASNADIKRTREEKRREEEVHVTQDAPGVALTSVLTLRPPAIPYQEIVDAYNSLMTGLPKVRDVTEARRTTIRKAWQSSKARQSIEFWRQYFEECADDAFLNGTGPYRQPHEKWRPDFDHLMKDRTITKVYEKALHEVGQ